MIPAILSAMTEMVTTKIGQRYFTTVSEMKTLWAVGPSRSTSVLPDVAMTSCANIEKHQSPGSRVIAVGRVPPLIGMWESFMVVREGYSGRGGFVSGDVNL